MTYVLLVISTMMAALAQFLFKIGVNSIGPDVQGIGPIIKAGVTSPYVWGGVLSYAINLSLWLYVLSNLELSKAYPMTSLAYIFTLLLGFFFLNEQFTIPKIIGVALIIGGVYLLTK